MVNGMCQSLTHRKRGGMIMNVDMAIAFAAGMLLGGMGGALVICILVGGNMRRVKHERVQNVIYRKKII